MCLLVWLFVCLCVLLELMIACLYSSVFLWVCCLFVCVCVYIYICVCVCAAMCL